MYSTKLENPKIVFFGATGSGKSAVIERLTQPGSVFNKNTPPTKYINYRPIKRDEHTLQIWDLSDDFRDFRSNYNLSHTYYRGSNLAVLCIDLSLTINKEEIQERINIFRDYWDANACPILLLGTKSDKKTATQQQIDLFNELVFEDIVEPRKLVCSAKESTNFDQLIELLTPQPASMELEEIANEHQVSDSQSTMETALAELKDATVNLCQDKKTRVSLYAAAIWETYTNTDIENTEKLRCILEKIDHISQCIDEIEHPVLKILASIAIIVFITLLAAMIGYAAGMVFGAWSGPGAFITAIAGATAAGIAAVGVSAAVGLGVGAGTCYLFFREEPNQTTHDALENVKGISESSLAPA